MVRVEREEWHGDYGTGMTLARQDQLREDGFYGDQASRNRRALTRKEIDKLLRSWRRGW